MKIVTLIICLSIALYLSACAGTHCFSGGYGSDGKTGNFSYCYSPEKSKDAGATVLEGAQGDSVLISESDAKKLNEQLDKQEKKAEKADATTKPDGGGEIKRLIERIRK